MWRDNGARTAKLYGYKRSSRWKHARKAHLKKQPSCVACKKQYRGFLAWFRRLLTGTVVHHIIPFHVCFGLERRDLELDSRNLLTLCAGHHFVIGHFHNYEEFNLYAKACVIRCWGYSPYQVWDNLEFQRFANGAYKPFFQWTRAEKDEFSDKLDDKFPPKN